MQFSRQSLLVFTIISNGAHEAPGGAAAAAAVPFNQPACFNMAAAAERTHLPPGPSVGVNNFTLYPLITNCIP